MMINVGYAFVIERAEDGACWAYLPDLPGCTTTGDTPEVAIAPLPEAVELYLRHLRDCGLPPPSPQARAAVMTAM